MDYGLMVASGSVGAGLGILLMVAIQAVAERLDHRAQRRHAVRYAAAVSRLDDAVGTVEDWFQPQGR